MLHGAVHADRFRQQGWVSMHEDNDQMHLCTAVMLPSVDPEECNLQVAERDIEQYTFESYTESDNCQLQLP